MSDTRYEPYDFRAKSGYTDASSIALNSWLKKTANVFSKHWRDVSSTELQVSVINVTTRTFESAIEHPSCSMMGCTVKLGPSELLAFWLATRVDLLTVVGQVLCNSVEDFEDRELTSVEKSICQLVFEYLTQSLSEAWPLQELLDCSVVEMVEHPSRARIHAAQDEVLFAELNLCSGDRVRKIYWLIGKEAARPLLISAFIKPSSTDSGFDAISTIRELPLELVGCLGNAVLPMSRLSSLDPGDLIVLDQRIDQPIVATVDGDPFCCCWPGQIGKSVGIEVSEIL